MARNFAYYEAITVRDSSLSACTQAVMAAGPGHLDLAYDYLAEAALVDLDDLAGNTDDGLHIASLAGTWIALVTGFGGMRCDADGLRVRAAAAARARRGSRSGSTGTAGSCASRSGRTRRSTGSSAARRCACRTTASRWRSPTRPRRGRSRPRSRSSRSNSPTAGRRGRATPAAEARSAGTVVGRFSQTCGEGDRCPPARPATPAPTGSSTSADTSRCSTNGSTVGAPRPRKRLEEVLHDETVGTPQALTERDVAAGIYADRLAALRAAEHGLAFGRLDVEVGEVRYIGRLGLLDEDNEYDSLLMDWRAPAARPLSTLRPRRRRGIRRRRHLRTRRREVTEIDDEILDLDAPAPRGPPMPAA